MGRWEAKYDLDPSNAPLDYDSDCLSNLVEFNIGTDPTNTNSDGDLFGDGVEVSTRSDPTDPMTPWLFIVSYIIAEMIITVLIFRMEIIYKKSKRSYTQIGIGKAIEMKEDFLLVFWPLFF